MRSSANTRFTNRVRTIFFVVLLVSIVCGLSFYFFSWQPPKSFVFASMLILFPVSIMHQSIQALLSTTELKDVSSSETHRLRHTASHRVRSIRYAMFFYVAGAIVLGVYIGVGGAASFVAATIAASVIFGLIAAAFYSAWIATHDLEEVSGFKSIIQERANGKSAYEAFNKKIADAKKS